MIRLTHITSLLLRLVCLQLSIFISKPKKLSTHSRKCDSLSNLSILNFLEQRRPLLSATLYCCLTWAGHSSQCWLRTLPLYANQPLVPANKRRWACFSGCDRVTSFSADSFLVPPVQPRSHTPAIPFHTLSDKSNNIPSSRVFDSKTYEYQLSSCGHRRLSKM